jgi:hypothetical protein
MYTKLAESYRKRILLTPQTTATGAGKYAAPTPGAKGITILCIAKMGNAADLALSLNYADDANGTNATAYPVNVPVYVGGVRQSSDAKAYTIEDATGDFVVEFSIDPATIPAGKTVGVAYGNSNVGTFLTTVMVEDVAYKPTPTV